ncbi:hypothetical protein MSAN_01182200 [Mycena sanguinolenta]|uniref:Uncharacterized protein n=1 Tax=Mycena sanguinolenta TaxID=230812 RepID=A0A8H6YNB8_9AGAR|nr:hypothetical protein MSAN_01182200 [Mycena sanguinolenta]
MEFNSTSAPLVKTVSQSVYDTWYTGPEIVQESSSIHGEEDTLDTFINDEEDSSSNSTAAGSSDDYDPIQDPDAESDDNMEVIPSQYNIRPAPIASKRKRESLDSEDEKPVKKLKLIASNISFPPTGTSTRKELPLFLPDSPSTPTPKPRQKGKGKSKRAHTRVTLPPYFVEKKLGTIVGFQDGEETQVIYINPWDPAYQPPPC